MTRFVMATTNTSKLRALVERVGPGLSLSGTAQHLKVPDEIECGNSFADIAAAKAIWYSQQIPDALIVGTDGGLVVPALRSRWDPLQTARFAGPRATPGERITRLLEFAGELHDSDRRIHWAEHLAVARNGELLASWQARGPAGLLATTPPLEAGAAPGFWVPRIWLCPEFNGRRLSELNETERLCRRDHWALLGEKLTAWAMDRQG